MPQDGNGEGGGGNVLPFKGSHDPAAALARQKRVFSLRLAGLTYQQIGDEIGYSAAHCHRLFTEALALQPDEVEEARALENARLDRQLAAVWPAAIGGDIGASTLVLRISERRARLLGLDAPREVIVTPAAAEVQHLVNEVLRLTGSLPAAIEEADIIEADVLEPPPPDDDPLADDFSWDDDDNNT